VFHFIKQGAGTHLKRLPDSLWCIDSKDSDEYPMEVFVDNHQVAGFCNTKSSATLCNAELQTIGEQVFLVATRVIRRGEEIFAMYYDRKAQKSLKEERKLRRAAKQAEPPHRR
jgi:hypothetical protein